MKRRKVTWVTFLLVVDEEGGGGKELLMDTHDCLLAWSLDTHG